MFILDTDMVSLLHAGDEHLRKQKDRFDQAEVVTTVITRIQILQGRFDFVMKAADGPQLLRALRWLERSESLPAEIIILPLVGAAAAQFDRLREHRNLRKIGRGDLLIASIALAHCATLVTGNLKDFRQVPGLQLENWAD